jgi:hypothetical protein
VAMKYDIMIGIDPDTKKSGVAIKRFGVLIGGQKYLEVTTLSFFALYDSLRVISDTYGNRAVVRIEAGWLNEKSNFFKVNRTQTKAAGERIAKNVGANHETGKKIVEMCEYLKLEYELIRPTSAKWTPAMLERATGISTKNQEKIDAVRLIL